MSFKCGLFDSTEIVEVVGGYPRGNKAQDADFFARFFKDIIGNGIPPNPTTNFQVLAQSGFTVQMRPGRIYNEGHMGYDDEVATFFIPENLRNAPVYISCRYDIAAQDMDRVVSNTFERSEAYNDLAVARIVIPSGAVEVTDVMIKDLRPDPAYCGYVQKITDTVAEELREEKLDKSEALDTFLPPGSVIMRLDHIDPRTLWPGTTWQRVFQGKSPIGFDLNDDDFKQVGKTGGSKTASYALGNSGYAKMDAVGTSPMTWIYDRKLASYSTAYAAAGGQGSSLSLASGTASRAVALGGTTDTGNNMHPFVVCCFWLRIS